VLRSNLNAQFWLSILNKCRKVIEKNLIAYGQLPNLLFEQGREVDLTDFVSSPVINPLRVLPCTSSALAKTELPKVAFGELLLDPSVRPKGEFRLLTWESRLPPHTSFIHFVPNCTQDMPQGHSLSGRKRHTVPFSDSMNYIQCNYKLQMYSIQCNYKLRMYYFHMCVVICSTVILLQTTG